MHSAVSCQTKLLKDFDKLEPGCFCGSLNRVIVLNTRMKNAHKYLLTSQNDILIHPTESVRKKN